MDESALQAGYHPLCAMLLPSFVYTSCSFHRFCIYLISFEEHDRVIASVVARIEAISWNDHGAQNIPAEVPIRFAC